MLLQHDAGGPTPPSRLSRACAHELLLTCTLVLLTEALTCCAWLPLSPADTGRQGCQEPTNRRD
jgi:hypothetical protein